MPYSHPFQKNITIHREPVKNDFLCINNRNWKAANRVLGPYGLQLYLYLASNKDNYNFYLSQEAAQQDVGICRTTFHNYINKMIEEGYLVQSKGNCYDFYEVPQFKQPQHPTEMIDFPMDF